MKKLRYLSILWLSILFFGCGNGGQDTGSNSSDITVSTIERSLPLNEKMEVISGEIYEARSDDAIINIEHNLTTNKRYITLLQGTGVIIKQ